MATRIYAVNPGGKITDVIEDVGPTATSAIIAVVVDLAAAVTDGGTTRGPSKEELVLALENILSYVMKDNSWPPA